QAAIRVKEGVFPAGTYVVKLDQPYRNYAVDLLTQQHYPKNGSEAYDDISWNFPAHYHLNVFPTSDPQARTIPLSAVTEAPKAVGTVTGNGPIFLLRDSGQENLLRARYALAKFKIEIAEKKFTAGGAEFTAGSWIVQSQEGLAKAMHSVADET